MKHEQLTEPDGLAKLAELARQTSAAIVEIGVHQGGSLVELAKHGGQVYGIDPWGMTGAYQTRPRMRRVYHPGNMAVAKRVLDEAGVEAELIRGFSVEVAKTWTEPVGLLYIDAVHTEAAVLADFRAWQPHLVPGAWVCFDDHNARYPGVLTAVTMLCKTDLDWIELAGTRLAVTRYGDN